MIPDQPRIPVDRTAALVVQKAPYLGKFNDMAQTAKNHRHHQERILEVLAKKNLNPIPKSIVNYTGQTFGRITVVAYSHKRVVMNKSRAVFHFWVVRCTCGVYEMRRHVALNKYSKGGNKGELMCSYCNRHIYLLRAGAFRSSQA